MPCHAWGLGEWGRGLHGEWGTSMGMGMAKHAFTVNDFKLVHNDRVVFGALADVVGASFGGLAGLPFAFVACFPSLLAPLSPLRGC